GREKATGSEQASESSSLQRQNTTETPQEPESSWLQREKATTFAGMLAG
ncbi:hypothetical protein A2U01_0113325, partial [Trifolium medium]|nr:hypothetical protein [Trifolium medium]